MEEGLKALILINAGTLIAIITFGYKIIRFINSIEFRTDLMWKDYENRMRPHNHLVIDDGAD